MIVHLHYHISHMIVQTCGGDVRGVQGQGGGAEEGGVVEGEQHQRDGGHVEAGEGEQAGAEEVHEGDEARQPCLRAQSPV